MSGEHENTHDNPGEPVDKCGGVTLRAAENRNAAWTEAMLATLARGIKGGQWYSLIDKLYAPRTLEAAFARVRANNGSPGADHVTIEMFEREKDRNLADLSDGLRTDTYVPSSIKRLWIDKGGGKKRPLGIPIIRDRVVHTALHMVLEPIFEREFHENSFGFRPGRGCKDALRKVEEHLRRGFAWVIDADISGFFDAIQHHHVLAEVERQVADGRILSLLKQLLKQRILDEGLHWEPSEGTPQGSPISPLLANIILNPLDHLINRDGVEMIRYADDFVVLCRSEVEALQVLEKIKDWLNQHGLSLHPEKTKVVHMQSPKAEFDFLGYNFCNGPQGLRRMASKRSIRSLRLRIKTKTRRKNGHALRTVIDFLNPTLRGWMEYFKHAHPWNFRSIDGFIRRRLRSLLRKRLKRRGTSRGRENREFPNTFFEKHGLFSLTKERVRLIAGP